MRTTAVILALTLVGANAAAVLAPPVIAQPADTTKVSTEPLFTERDLWIAGGFVLTTVALYPADRALAREIQRDPLQDNRFLSESADFFNFMGITTGRFRQDTLECPSPLPPP